jgi:hypothetical protein
MKNLMILGSWFEVLPRLTDEQAGKLFKGFGKWLNNEEVIFDDAILQGFWFGIEGNLSNMEKKYESKVQANKENGKKGGRPKTQDNPNNPSGFLETQITQPNPKNLKEKEIEKEKEKEKDKYNEIETIVLVEEDNFIIELKLLYSQFTNNGELTDDDRILYYELFKQLKKDGYYVDKYKIEEYGII